ncbi:hypothetical protein [Caldicellulosiruptor naganoensis]|uniref:Transmembrane protein n=1 Tax=Caldicellulosiruptor naganoensis TaxID=29324 RepID=A0ABY7BIT6_9FIRM|nr:hypothetical protein [Caldicellulosiruptor naganoensis]WAM32323.1 hypothetical protein OTJ99_000854 [Caldicellulosiruptor naganoensis]
MKNKMSNRKYEAVIKLDVANKKVVAIITYSILITILPLGWWMANFGEVMFKSRQPNRIIVSIITIIGIIFYSYYLNFCNNKSQISRIEFIWMLFTAFFVRLALGGAISGHPIDVNCFKAWMNIASTDMFNIYEKNIFIDYLPGYLIILALFKNIASIVHSTISEDLLIKLPNILADIAIGVMVLGLKQKCGSRPTREESTIILFNPALILLSSLWGQSDSFVSMLLVMLFVSLVYNAHILAGCLAAYLLFTKPQFILYFPLIALYWVYNLWLRNRTVDIIKQIISFSIVSGGLYFLFMPHKEILWLPKFFIKIAGEYPYYTVNAFNIYYAGGLNWVKTGGMYNCINMIVLAIAYILVLAQIGVRLEKPSDHLIQLRYLLQGGFIVGLLSYNLMTGMHERYSIFAWLFCLMVYVLINDIRWLRISMIISLLTFLNISKVLDLSLSNIYFVQRDLSNFIVAIANIVILFASLYIITNSLLKHKNNAKV